MQALANMVVMLNDEVFARKPSNPNKPLKKASHPAHTLIMICLLYTSDAADE